ncbi:aldehyde ferredoxin oxidoreductase family protein [Clostridium botulinum]|uniref:Tungsten-containing aldehyde ferredoxin oxidoreductase n=1 Tax=Clostridium botulinum (strain Hall / ATCC 3502 / NCTC 13319 / Type A) TaxID=441771 RepID=A5I360_CLOBH|nr:aldehyde ferredoxin oxidoreductase family protein [Clostridium botulinum]ABS32898.1 aldehyde ferredoxin oxidoreductase, tungsten-containing [Clostridium botulinum A str. ATCC 19397]ABS38239.1 aldehyde ferredoxin oxidoreductase, tungsten-containing [Clostridium botulinum A str. Hall]AWB17808.1 aldehyde ferredoxin oxidoreductase [Clostridium botulinum]AWB30594.1 aldehyde ferredoxin oxidoreductase [Clostridium botulinum]EGT5614550.1 aldehyde ferredoxin oxidoreductase [Clostridium botulinum]
MYGYNGKILRIDLTNRNCTLEPLDEEKAKKFIGARGLGVKTLLEEIDPKIDPLSIENKLVIVTGPITGAPMPTSGRYMVVTKAPLTGTIAISNSGGKWGTELKNAGYDMIIVQGKSEVPVYVNIEDDKIEIKEAEHLWGKTSLETTKILCNENNERAKVLCIGPAGEKLSLMAAIMNDIDRAAGRGGVGAVMGSKNLKAIVVKGSGKVKVVNGEEAKKISLEKIKILREDPVAGGGLPTYGSAVLVNIINENGVHPVRNFQKSYTDEADKISGETLTEDCLVRKNPCYRCPIACGRWVKLDDGTECGGPEYETLWSFGSDCDVYDLNAINVANMLCNEYGLDTISAGATIAAAMELYEKGYIKDEDIKEDGLSLKWGDAEAVVGWTKKMALREGFGDKMADGSYRLCESYGVPEFSMTVKKQELPAYDPRGIQGHGITYAVNNRGGCHIKGYMISPEILGYPEKLDRFSLEGKAAYAKIFHDLTAVIDSLGLCIFTTFGLGVQDYVDMYNVVVGGKLHNAESIMEAGDRIWTLEKLFNLEAGIDSSHDTLPKRLLKEPIPEGPSKGCVHKLSELLPEYYAVRGWDKNGIPTEDTLKKLGLEEYIK